MSRLLVAVLLVLLVPSSALAARAWDPPALVTADAPSGAVSQAADGTVATAWIKGTDAVAQVGSGAPVDLGAAGIVPIVAAASAHEAAVAWTALLDGADETYVALFRDGVAGAPTAVGAGRPVALPRTRRAT